MVSLSKSHYNDLRFVNLEILMHKICVQHSAKMRDPGTTSTAHNRRVTRTSRLRSKAFLGATGTGVPHFYSGRLEANVCDVRRNASMVWVWDARELERIGLKLFVLVRGLFDSRLDSVSEKPIAFLSERTTEHGGSDPGP